MFGSDSPPGRKPDRRALRTQQKLGKALWDLLQENALDALTVQQVLDRAGVGRATFYAHYLDKDDLLLGEMERFLEATAGLLDREPAPSARLLPVREIFAHVAEAPRYHAILVESNRMRDFLELAQGIFARAIERRLATQPGAQGLAPERRALLAHVLAGALIALLNWWLDHDRPLAPERVDEIFHALAWNGVRAGGGA